MADHAAFAVYGKFHWPPLPLDQIPDPAAAERTAVEGKVEIFYADSGGDLVARVRWTPRHPSGPPRPTAALLTVSHDGLLAAIGDGSRSFVFLLDDREDLDPPKYWGPRLAFRGAVLLDQFDIDANSAQGQLNRRWLLARRFSQGQRLFFSTVVIGHVRDSLVPGGVTFGFNVALPAPAPQAVIDNSTSHAVPFRVRYRPKLSRAAGIKQVPIHIFAAGPERGPASDREVDFETAWPAGRGLNQRHLGGFGFCRTDGGADYLFFPRPSNADRKKYWLDDQKIFVDEVLRKLGNMANTLRRDFSFASTANPEGDSSPGDEGERWNSIGFLSDPGRPTRTVMNFRTGIFANQDASVSSGDIGMFPPAGQSNTRHFMIREPTGGSRWIETESSDLLVDLELDYDIADEAIWPVVADPRKARIALRVRLGFVGKLSGEIGDGDLDSGPGSSNEIAVDRLIAAAIKGMRLARLDLQNVEAGQPQSLLPEFLRFDQVGDSPRFAYCATIPASLRPANPAAAADIDLLEWGEIPANRPSWPRAQFRLTLWPHDERRTIDPKMPVSVRAKISLPSFTYPASQGGGEFVVTLWHDREAYNPEAGFAYGFRLRKHSGPAIAGRVGGFEFRSEAGVLFQTEQGAFSQLEPGKRSKDEAEEFFSYWRFAPRTRLSGYWPAEVDVRLRISASTILPLGVDIPWGDRSGRPRPLLIGVGEPAVRGGGGRYILDAVERVSAQSDRQLVLTVTDKDLAGTRGGQYVVLSERPFSIVKFDSRPLGDRGSAESAQVAFYDSDTRSWQLKLVSPTYHYQLPPQSVGESMDKPRRLELHDLDGGDPLRPYLPDENGVERRRAVEFRLTPSAELWIRPSDVERGYFLPEWASYEMFRQAGALGLGAALAAFRGEFLYGLAVGVDTSEESGAARDARVAEIEALLGRPPGAISASAQDPILASRWAATSTALARRPERLEMWMREPGSAMPFTPARFSAGVRFALRDTAVHSPPIVDAERLPPEWMADKRPRLRKHGLRGGAIWPLESANFCRALIEAPESKGGLIERIALSPTGGDADQRAEFLNGKLAIISETRNGHVQRHRVEIIGRIAVFWHRAKHVVVYERTANPSAQFTPEGGIGTRTRRPVLRKVSEYIELLQPIRAYPDFPGAGAASAAFLRAVRFNSRLINVDSAWSEEVGDFGWKIPLWNRRSARLRPTVYPRPDIAFVTASEGEGDSPVTAQECLDPDNIYFFADASLQARDLDTDQWATRIALDYTNLPPPRPDHQPDLDGGVADGRPKPSAVRIPRGHRRFTWRLAPSARKTTINAEHGDQPIYAGLESITFMRSSAAGVLSQSAKVEAKLDKAREGLAESPEGKYAAITGTLRAFNSVIEGNDADRILAAARALTARLKEPTAQVWSYAQRLGPLHEIATEGPSQCEKLVADFAGSFHRKKLLILDQIRSWAAAPVDHFPTLEDWQGENGIDSKEKLVDAIVDRVMILIGPSLAEVQADVGNLGNSVEQARDNVRDFHGEIGRALDRARKKLDEIEASYDLGKPWSPHRLEEFHRRVAAVRDRVLCEIETAAVEIQSRLATELNGLTQKIAIEVGAYLRSVSLGESSLREALGSAEGAARAYLRTAYDRLVEAQPEVSRRLDALTAKLDEAIQQAPNHADRLRALKAGVEDLRSLYSEIVARIGALAEGLGTAAGRIDEAIVELADELRAFLVEARDYASSTLAALEAIVEAELQELKQSLVALTHEVAALPAVLADRAARLGERPDWMVKRLRGQLDAALTAADGIVAGAFASIEEQVVLIRQGIDQLETTLEAHKVAGALEDYVVRPAVDDLLKEIKFADYQEITEEKLKRLRDFFRDMDELVERHLDDFDKRAAEFLQSVQEKATQACRELKTALSDAYQAIADQLQPLLDKLAAAARQIDEALADVVNAVTLLKDLATQIDEDVKGIGKDLTESYAAAQAYADRVFEAAGNLTSGGLAALPGNFLRCWSAVASAPELAGLENARERLGYYYDELKKYVDTTKAEAWFGRLGDELKAMGISLPFDKIGDGLIPDDLSKLDIGRIFKNFGGIDFDKLLGGYKLPAEAKDSIRISHAFDKKQLRAWVQIDIDLPLPGRKALFTAGPFKLDFVDSRMVGILRLEASKDSQEVEQTGRASFHTDIDAVVSGQSMVTLRKVVLNYERTSGLKVDFDPKNIRLNPAFQFVQETLASLFPSNLGGLKIIKKDGIPVGVEHEFSMPPVSLMAGTSGVSNIQIANRFALIAHPDFVISDRFSLSSPEKPFLFSIFIIGGTGYINVDCEYRPFGGGGGLTVIVEAAAGGSAALGFAAGPVSGAVFVTLSIALSYRKVIGGGGGGGLTASLVLVIAGNVDVAGIASVYMGLLLRMAYRENGDIDGVGTLTITIEISRWFKFKVRRNVDYKLRKGRSQTTSSTQISSSADERLEQAKALLEARG